MRPDSGVPRFPGRRGPRLRVHPGVVYTVLGFVLLFTLVWQKSTTDHLLLQLEKAEAEHRALETRVAALRVQAQDLSGLTVVEDRAVKELGLRRPLTEEIVELRFEAPRTGEHFALGPLVPEANAGTRRGNRR